jgi:hypothetical protein
MAMSAYQGVKWRERVLAENLQGKMDSSAKYGVLLHNCTTHKEWLIQNSKQQS